jgi:autotransporter-associated beta strand protein
LRAQADSPVVNDSAYEFNDDHTEIILERDVLYTGQITGSGTYSIAGSHALIMRAVQPFEGDVRVTGTTLRLAIDDALNRTGSIEIREDDWGTFGTFDLNGHSMSHRNLNLRGGILRNGSLGNVGNDPSLITSFGGGLEDITGKNGISPPDLVLSFNALGNITTLTGSNHFRHVTVASRTELHLISGSTTVDELVVKKGGEFQIGSSQQNATFSGTIKNGGLVTLITSADQDWANVISDDGPDTGSLVKDGDRTLVIKTVQNFTGTTTIRKGTLKLGVNNALDRNSSLFAEGGGGLDLNGRELTLKQVTLDSAFIGSGSFTGPIISKGGSIADLTGDANVTLESNSTTFIGNNEIKSLIISDAASLSLQDANKTLTVKGTVTFNAGSRYVIAFDGANVSQLKATGTIDFAGAKLVINANNVADGFSGGRYVIASSDTAILNDLGSFEILGLPNLRARTAVEGNNVVLSLGSDLGGIRWRIYEGGVVDFAGASRDFDILWVNGGTLKNAKLRSLQSRPLDADWGFISNVSGKVDVDFYATDERNSTIVSGANDFGKVTLKGKALVILTGETQARSVEIHAGAVLSFGDNNSDGLINQNIRNGGSIHFKTARDMIWSKVISDFPGLRGEVVKFGNAILTFNTVQTYTGTTVLSGGTLRLGVDNAINENSAIFVDTFGTLDLDNEGTVTNENIYHAKVVRNVGAGRITNSAGASWTGDVTDNQAIIVNDGSWRGNLIQGRGELRGSGTFNGNVTINGGLFKPGSDSPGSKMVINGDLTLGANATFTITFDPTQSTSVDVSGKAVLNGTFSAIFNTGTYVTRDYLVLKAAGGIEGTFTTFTNPGTMTSELVYNTNNVTLRLTADAAGDQGKDNIKVNTMRPVGNQLNVARTIDRFFNAGGELPRDFLALYSLTGEALVNGLAQLSGEVNTGAQTTAFGSMSRFLRLATESQDTSRQRQAVSRDLIIWTAALVAQS